MDHNLEHISQEINRNVIEWENRLALLDESDVTNPYNRQGRNIKQLLGHLVDSANNNLQRIVRLQYTPNLVFPDYTAENDLWISIQRYSEFNWQDLVQCWKYLNLHLSHIIKHIDKSWLKNEWSDGKRDPQSLEDIVYNYLAHFSLHLNEIKSLLTQHVRNEEPSLVERKIL